MTEDGLVLLRPGDAAYEAARAPAVARFRGIRPRAVARCASPEEVAAAVAHALRERLPLAARSGGHCFAGHSSTDGLLIDVSPLRSVAVHDDGTATVGAGTRLGDLYYALLAHGRTLPAGCGPTVGIAGLTLGGGLGVLGRLHGLTCDSLLAVQVVLADGRIADCDKDREPDLFWALRGAGGCRFGIVTALTFRTIAPPAATAFELSWPGHRAAEVIAAWQRWAPAGPDELAASLLVGVGAGPPAVTVVGTMIGTEPETAAVLGGLEAEPRSAALHHGPHREIKRRLAERGDASEDDGILHSRSEFFRAELPPAAVAELVERLTDDAPGAARELDFSPWGGAYNRVPAAATAFPHRAERFLLKQSALVAPGGDEAAALRWLERSWAVAHPWGAGGVYANFPEPGLDPWSPAYHGANRERLLAVKRRYDPDGVFS